MDYLIAFLVGGAICAVVQMFLDIVKLQPGNMMVLLVCIGAILGAAGIYEPFKEWAGAGASVPLSGFGNTLFQGIKEDVDAKGFIGIFTGGFTSSAVGISGALIMGYIASLIYKPSLSGK